MAEIALVLGHDPYRLLDRAADVFLAPRSALLKDPFPTPPVLLALRQGGLRDDLIRRAAECGVKGWFDPPLCVFEELPDWLGSSARRACGDVERRVLLGRVFREQGGEVFNPRRRGEDYLQAVSELFGELCSEDVHPDRFEAACETRRDRDAFERRRDDELVAAYREYRARLNGHGLRDGRDALVDSARCVAADPAALAARLRGRREIRIFGLNDLRGGWRVLLRTLAECPALDRVEIYTSVELDLAGIPHSTEVVDEQPSLATRLFSGEPGGARPSVRVVVAPELARELEEIACRVRARVDAGVPPGRIAVIARQARPHVDAAVQALEAVGVPASARQRVGLREVPVVRAILLLFDAAAGGWTRAGLAEIAEHPYFDCALQPEIVQHVGRRARVVGLDAWEQELSRLLAHASGAAEPAGAADPASRRERAPGAAQLRDALRGFRDFRAVADRLDSPRPLSEWVDLLADLLHEDPWGFARRMHTVPAGRFDPVRLDLAGWAALHTRIGEWQRAHRSWGGGDEVLIPVQFALAVREILDGDIPLWTEAHRGVAVQEAFAAAYRSFDHVFIVGLEAGSFPPRAPASPILDDAERDALVSAGVPLDPASAWERREAELFRTLVAGARESLTLSHAARDAAGHEVIGSGFVEAVLEVASVTAETIPASRVRTPGFPEFATPEAANHAHRVARIERVRQTGRLSPYNGEIADPELRTWLATEFGDQRVWSPTQLESFAKCPWSYFASRLLHLETVEDPSDELDPTVRGRILHRVLEQFYAAARERADSAPVLLVEVDLEWALARAETELDDVLARFAEREWLGTPALLDARRAELLRIVDRYLRFEVEHNRKLYSNRSKNVNIVRTGVVEHEVAFDDVTLEIEGVVVRFRGSIDRVEEGIDERVPAGHFVAAVDYKTTRSSVPGGGDAAAWDDGVVLQVPLYAHALAQLRPGKTVSRIEYRTIRSRGVEHMLPLHTVDRTGALVADPAAHGQMERALRDVATHVKAARSGSFPARPAPSCLCSPFCVAWDVCRVRGGPETKGW